MMFAGKVRGSIAIVDGVWRSTEWRRSWSYISERGETAADLSVALGCVEAPGDLVIHGLSLGGCAAIHSVGDEAWLGEVLYGASAHEVAGSVATETCACLVHDSTHLRMVPENELGASD